VTLVFLLPYFSVYRFVRIL